MVLFKKEVLLINLPQFTLFMQTKAFKWCHGSKLQVFGGDLVELNGTNAV